LAELLHSGLGDDKVLRLSDCYRHAIISGGRFMRFSGAIVYGLLGCTLGTWDSHVIAIAEGKAPACDTSEPLAEMVVGHTLTVTVNSDLPRPYAKRRK
jgi:hypothetical protein